MNRMGNKMSANDNTEKVLRQMHILLSKSEPYPKEPTKVIIDKQKMIDLLADLNKCIYDIQDEYELTETSRNRAEREFRKKGDKIVWDASRKAEDVYAASVMYTDEALTRVWEILHETNESVEKLYDNMREKIKEQEILVKTNQSELKSQLQDLSDTEKYLRIIDERNREIARQKEAGKPRTTVNNEASIYANRQTEVKVNTEYLKKLGLMEEDGDVDGVVEGSKKIVDSSADGRTSVPLKSDSIPDDASRADKALSASEESDASETLPASDEELEAMAHRFDDLEDISGVVSDDEGQQSAQKEGNDSVTDGIHKLWQSITESMK